MAIIYWITLLILFFTMLLLKKNDKKKNILCGIVFMSCIILFYDVFIAYMLTHLNIKNTLLIYSLIYLLTSAVLIGINYYKENKITYQKYYLDKKQLIGFIIIIIVSFALGASKYNKFTEIDYLITDAAIHYRMADYYSIIQKIFNVAINDGVRVFNKPMFGYLVPCGLFMEIMPCAKYISYNLFNTSMICLIALTAYILCLEMKTEKKGDVLAPFLVLMYLLAYPLNYMIYGFGYLGCGILATTLIIYTWKLIIKEERKSLYIILTLFNIGLFFSYYLFVPVIFLAEGLFIIYRYMEREYSLKKLFKLGIVTLLIPTVMGYMYFLFKGSINDTISNTTNSLVIEGSAYKNLWGNFILLLPMIIYSVVLEIKNKKIDFDIFFLIIELIYLVITLYFTTKARISTYYFYKPYFILWLICYTYIFKLVNYKNYKTNLIINYSIIVLMIILAITETGQKIFQTNVNFNSHALGPELANVYRANYTAFNPIDIVDNETAKLILKSTKYYDKCEIKGRKKTIPYTGNFYQKLWYYGLTSNSPTITYNKNNLNEVFTKQFDYAEFLKDEKVKCAVVTNRYLEKNKIDISMHKVLYKNKAGSIIKKK